MDDQREVGKQQPILEDLMQNVFPLLFYILFPGFILGFYFSIPLGLVASFVGFFMFRVHCHLLFITSRLEKIAEILRDDRT